MGLSMWCFVAQYWSEAKEPPETGSSSMGGTGRPILKNLRKFNVKIPDEVIESQGVSITGPIDLIKV